MQSYKHPEAGYSTIFVIANFYLVDIASGVDTISV